MNLDQPTVQPLNRAPTSSQRKFLWVLFGVLFFATTYVHQRDYDAPTAVSRLDLLHAVVEHHTVNIDAYHKNTDDKAAFGGHFYSDKAPGTVVLALPAFLAANVILRWAGMRPDSNESWLYSSWLACAGSIALVTSAGGCALHLWLCNHVRPRIALITTLTIFLGAAPLPYSTMMFSHALVAGFLAIAIWAIDGDRTHSPARALPCGHREIVAGLCCGIALASEYTAGIVVAAIAIWACLKPGASALRFFAACLVPLLLVPLYSFASLGYPLALPYSYNTSFPAMREGLYAIKWPDAGTGLRLLFGSARGLFFWTPFLLLAVGGYAMLSRVSRARFWFTYAPTVISILVMSGRVWDWEGGPSFGARYLTPTLPLLALPCAIALQACRTLGVSLSMYSIAAVSLATVTGACTYPGTSSPLTQVHGPLFQHALFAPNLGLVLGLPPDVSLVPYYFVIAAAAVWLLRTVAHCGNVPCSTAFDSRQLGADTACHSVTTA